MNEKYKHIHIVGSSPRSGTTLLAELFRTSFNIDGFYDHEKSIFKCDPWNYSILVSKAPTEAIYFPWLLTINPNLWCIYIFRDPRDVICSFHRSVEHTFLSNLRIWNTYHKSAKRSANHPRFITVKYEDLVNHPDRVQQQLIKLLPFLQIRNKFSQFGVKTTVSDKSSIALNEARKIDNKSIGRWKLYPGRIKAQMQLHGNISPTLIELGYEKDCSWETSLRDVATDTTPSGVPDFLSWHKTLRVKYRIIRKIFFFTFLTRLSRH